LASDAESYSIDWSKISGGGGTSAGGVYSVNGTIGQSDAGPPMSGGDFTVKGGFWGMIAPVQIPAAVVTVVATDATAGEPGSGQGTGTFTFSRTGSTAAALKVNFTAGGTATSGSDYTSLGTAVSFAAGSATVTKTVSVIDDSIVESDETVVVTLAAGAGYTLGIPSSATVRIKDDEPAVVVVDDPAATLVGTWTVSTAFPNYYGSGYRHDGNAGKGSKSATFTPNLPAAGNYGVYIWYTADAGRANNVPVDIVYNGGSTTVSVNQQVNGAKWNLLGTYSFSAGTGGYARIRTTGTSGYVIADAVRWVRTGSLPLVAAEIATGADFAEELFLAWDSKDRACAARLSKSQDGRLALEWATEPGVDYTVYGAIDVSSGWDVVQETVGDGSVHSIAVTPPWRFFRVRSAHPGTE
jgi:hypothetical protein